MEQSILELHPGLVWGFGITVVIMLMLDLGIFNKKSHVVTNKEATVWTIVWISLAMVFSGVVYYVFNQDTGGHDLAIEKFTQFQAAYWIEKALSVDNLFVFILVFGYFKVPRELHHKVLFWGILGALLFRAIFIFVGVEIINATYLIEFIQNNNIWHYAIWSFVGLLSIILALKYLKDERSFLIIKQYFIARNKHRINIVWIISGLCRY